MYQDTTFVVHTNLKVLLPFSLPLLPKKANMMWPSQNFFLHNGTIMQLIKKRIFKLVWQSPPPFLAPRTNYNDLISKKGQTILKPKKYI